MRKPNFSNKQIAAIADRWRSGESQASIALDMKTTQSTIWYWTTGQKISPKTVAENRKLRHSIHMLKREVKVLRLQRKAAAQLIIGLQPSKRRRSLVVPLLRANHNLSRAQANEVVGLSKIAGHVSLQQDRALIDLMWSFIARHPYAGFKTLCGILKFDMPGSRHHALDIYQQAIARIENRAEFTPTRRPVRHMPAHESTDRMWSVDFMQGLLMDGSEYWIFTGIDDFNREALFAKVVERRSARVAIETIDTLRKQGRVPATVRSDNGREFRSLAYGAYLQRHKIRKIHTRLYVARDNSYIENLNKLIRYDVLERHQFKYLAEVQRQIDDWLLHYNYARPQKPLCDLSPLQFSHENKLGFR